VHNLGHPPRRLVMLHLDGSGHLLPELGAEVSLGEVVVGKVTSAAQHHEMGPIALALVTRRTDEAAELSVGGIAAAQELIVPASAGKAANIDAQRTLLMGKRG
jgi:folate-binding Fe-S cluster repair protein YgfZ